MSSKKSVNSYNKPQVGEKLTEFIDQNNLTQSDLADKIGASSQNITDWKDSGAMPAWAMFNMLMEYPKAREFFLPDMFRGASVESRKQEKSEHPLLMAEGNIVAETNDQYSDPCKDLKLDIVHRTLAIVEGSDKEKLSLLITFLKGLEAKEEVQPAHRER